MLSASLSSYAPWLLLCLEQATAFTSPHASWNALARDAPAQDVCVPAPGGVAMQPQVIVYPVTVQEPCPTNTIIVVPGCPETISVTNAPTSLTTVVTATTTVTATVTDTTTAASPTATGLSPAAQDLISRLNLWTAAFRRLIPQAQTLDNQNAQFFAGELNEIEHEISAYTAAEPFRPLNGKGDQQAITQALIQFEDAQIAVLNALDNDASANSGNSTASASPNARVKRQESATKFDKESLMSLITALKALENAVNGFFDALKPLLPGAESIISGIERGVDDAYNFTIALLERLLAALGGPTTTPPTSTSPSTSPSGNSSMPMTTSSTSMGSNSSSTMTSMSGSGGPTFTSNNSTTAPITSSSGSTSGSPTVSPTLTSTSGSSSSSSSSSSSPSTNGTSFHMAAPTKLRLF